MVDQSQNFPGYSVLPYSEHFTVHNVKREILFYVKHLQRQNGQNALKGTKSVTLH
jgi:hypothetical protein